MIGIILFGELQRFGLLTRMYPKSSQFNKTAANYEKV